MPDPRFLVVRLGSLGDIVHTFPAVSALRQSFPDAEIIWLTHPRWKTLVASSTLASQIWTADSRALPSLRNALEKIRSAHFDAAIDYQGLWKSASLPFLAGVKKRIGFSSASVREFGVPLLYTEKVSAASAHIADQNGELTLRAGASIAVANFTLQLPAGSEAAHESFSASGNLSRYVVLSPGGGWRSKCWPPERYGALCAMIRAELDFRCVVNCGPGEDDLAAAVKAASGTADPILYNGDLAPLMAVLQNATCIVGGDTGPLHLAIALGVPAVAIFGPTDPARNGPYHPPNNSSRETRSGNAPSPAPRDIVLRAPNVATTHARGASPHPSLWTVTVETVFQAVTQILKAQA